MNYPLQIRLAQFLLQETPSNLLSRLRLFQIHSLLITTGLQFHNPPTLFSLFKLYLSNTSTFSHATNLFPQVQEPNKWNLMIRHTSATSALNALTLFQEMRSVIPFDDDPFIYASVIKACNKARALLEARVFRDMPRKDVISWNSVICGYANSGDFARAFSLFREMRAEKVGVDRVSFSCLLSSCAASKDIYLGKLIHARVKANGLECDVSVGTALINMYARCGKVEFARKVFDEMPKRNIEYWNAMIHAYIENGLAREALKLLDQIKSKELELDEVTFLGLIMACRDSGYLHQGILVHSIVGSKNLFKTSIVLGNALIDMYAKCGSMTKARAAFDSMSQKDVISWTSVIVGHAINGEGDKSLATFKQMCIEKFVPNSITFIGVLSACDHAGLVDQGRKLYDLMFEVYNIKPEIEHCGCVVDMLARAGKIEDAQIFIRHMPMDPNALVWRMLMNGCRVHGHINLGLNLVTSVKELNASDFVISSNIYAEAGRWSDVVSRRNFMVVKKSRKAVGRSSVSYLTE